MDADAASYRSGSGWDASAFTDLCAATCVARSTALALCRKIQEREWQLLFDYCYRCAGGPA